MDPQNQLCTDDFAGHLAHNCNLSVKAIIAVGAWGNLLHSMGEVEKGREYITTAAEMARKWQQEAFDNEGSRDGGHYRLAFDREGSWSIKYNLVWDKLLGLNLFDDGIGQTETAFYIKKFNRYGLPLDNRSDYTKSDWQIWSTVLTDDPDYMEAIVSAMWNFLCDTPDRVPFTDWYYTSSPRQRGFQGRAVQGGLFLPMLQQHIDHLPF